MNMTPAQETRDPLWEIENNTTHLKSVRGLLIDLVNGNVSVSLESVHALQMSIGAIVENLDSAIECMMAQKREASQ